MKILLRNLLKKSCQLLTTKKEHNEIIYNYKL
jgi:hypothetical protein